MSVAPPDGPPTATRPSRGLFLFALLLFLVSGATGLVYEVAWTRRLLLLLGSTATASSIVLATYLGGLGLGAVLGGRVADRASRPLQLYGLFELLGAAWALFVPIWLAGLEGAYVGAASAASPGVRAGLRVVLAVAVVLPGAVAVGATFPALLRAFSRSDDDVGPAAVLLYGVNTLGAVAGALWAGFTGIFTLGVLGSTRVAAAAAAAAGVAALLAGGRVHRTSPGSAAAPTVGHGSRAPLLVAALTGFVSLGLEASGIRILVFFVEGFTPSFAAMVAVFLAGLALGSLGIGPLLARRSRPDVAVGVLLAAAGLLVLAALVLLPEAEPWLRPWRDRAYAAYPPIDAQRRVALLGSALLFLPPALALGAAFPLTVRWAARGRTDLVGRLSGRVYLWNSVGAVLGPVLVLALAGLGASGDRPGGPLLAWALLGLVALASGAAIVLLALLPRGRWAWAGAALGLVAVFGVPTALARATPEALVRAGRVLRGSDGRLDPARRLLDVRADETVTASVVATAPSDVTLYTDEFAAASTGRDYAYMRMLGHLPVLTAATPEHALVIAFGTGTTAGAVAAHPEVKRLEIAETSRAVLDLAPFFAANNRGVLADPRVVLRVEDGRNVLLHHAADLDVITLEPLMPYTPAALPFYTREFYELARDRLRDGGVLCQWIPIHAMPVDLYAALVRTFFEVFPDGSLWYFEQSSVLIGRRGAKRPTPEAVALRVVDAAPGLTAAGLRGSEAVRLAWVASGRRVREVLDDPSKSSQEAIRAHPPGELAREVVTDERPFPEASPAPRAGLRTSYLSDTLLWLAGLVDGADDPGDLLGFGPLPLPGWWPTEIPAAVRAEIHLTSGEVMLARAMEAQADFRASEAAVAAADADRFASVGAEARAAAARRVFAERSAQARALREAAAEAYRKLLFSHSLQDANVERRLDALEPSRLVDAAEQRFAAAAAAARAGDPSGAVAARDEALLVVDRLAEIVLRSPPTGTGPVRFLMERLDDADPAVRAGVWKNLAPRIPAALRVSAGYTPDADLASRKAAVARLLEGLSGR